MNMDLGWSMAVEKLLGFVPLRAAPPLAGPLARCQVYAEVIRALAPSGAGRSIPTGLHREDAGHQGARNRHVVRYTLFQLEKRLSGCDYDEDSELYSLEHTLPENPGRQLAPLLRTKSSRTQYTGSET